MAEPSGILSKAGIFGWDQAEPVILSALLAGKRPLLIGDHGSTKTDGTKLITKLLIGKDAKFRDLEVPNLNPDDLFGYINPVALQQEKPEVEYLPTPMSLWGADGVNLDEINRANVFTAGKLHEVVRRGTLMGIPTGVRFVFGAVNPPADYASGYMDLALASRWCSVEIPGLRSLKADVVKQIVSLEKGREERIDDADREQVIKQWNQASLIIHSDSTRAKVAHIVAQIARGLVKKGVRYSGRQARDLFSLLCAYLSLVSVGLVDSRVDTMVSTALSTIPETHGIVGVEVERETVLNFLQENLEGLALQDPLVMASSLAELSELYEYEDSEAWAQAMSGAIRVCNSKKDLESAWNILNNALVVKPVPLADTIIRTLRSAIISMGISKNTTNLGMAEQQVLQLMKKYALPTDQYDW